MSMPTVKTTYVLAALFSSVLFLTGCNKDKEPTATTENQTSSSQDAIGQLNQTPIKQFPATADDAHDIAVLDDYDRRFTEMTDSMEIELAKMKQENTLTPEFEAQRQKDNVNSALTMLKDLDLKLNKDAIFKVCYMIIGKAKQRRYKIRQTPISKLIS